MVCIIVYVGETQQQKYDRERLEDEQEYAHFLRTGVGIPNEEVMAWLENLSRGEAAEPPKERPLGLPHGVADT